MRVRARLLASACLAVSTCALWAPDAFAADPSPALPRHHAKAHRRAPGSDKRLDVLLEEVDALKASLAEERSARLRLEAEVQKSSVVADQRVAAAEAHAAAAEAKSSEAIETLPAAVATEVRKDAPPGDALYVRGLKITLGGFLEAAEVYRAHDTGNDISTALNTIPFPQSRAGHAEELLFTPRQSRIAALVEGRASKDVTLAMYGEFDFQGAAQSSNSNETNSYVPRIRHLYGTIDWNAEGWHLLAGQTFSLVTLDSKGITPRNEVTPLTIDGQYHVGFDWARQPVFRIVKDFDKTFWVAVSLENPQTTFTGTVPAGVVDTINNGQGYYAGETNTGAAATQSLNHVPDVVAKAAVEEDLAGHHVHAEVYGLARDFYEELPTFKTNNTEAGGVGFGLSAQVIPKLFDVQASGLFGRGIGRYGSGQLPDVTFNPNGDVVPIKESIALVGGIVHATPSLDIWSYAGEEHDDRASLGTIGYGNPLFSDAGCEVQNSTATCTGNTRLLTETSVGFWQRIYQGSWGQARFGLQYSYVERNAFSGLGGAPAAHENMLYTSFRYYPFQ